MSGIKRIDIAEFRREGYLQELNRRFLHPLGLALEVVIENDGTERLGGVWDYRDDPEGMNYSHLDPLPADVVERAERIDRIWAERETARLSGLGYMVQPLGGAT